MSHPDFNDPGLLSPPETGMLTDLYELAMAATYHREEMNEPAVFELFVRKLPPKRDWLLAAGLGPALRLVSAVSFSPDDLEYLEGLGYERPFLDYLAGFRFSGDVDAMPEGTVFFANEPMLRVTAPRIEAQVLETLLLNQLNFQTLAATKAARVVLAAGGGEPGAGSRVVDFSPRRDHGVDAAMKVARSAAVAGATATSNVAAAKRYGLTPIGTMAHSFVLSFRSELEAFRAFLRTFPENGVLLVDTYDVEEGVRNAIEAARACDAKLRGIRIDSGDLDQLSRGARRMLDDAGLPDTAIVVSGDLDEVRIAELVAAAAPIDSFGVGTDLGTSRDSPTVNGVYKLVADADPDGGWRGVRKLSAAKETLPGRKQVFRRFDGARMSGDVVALEGESIPGEPLLVPAMREGRIVTAEGLAEARARTDRSLAALPDHLRVARHRRRPRRYPVAFSARLSERG